MAKGEFNAPKEATTIPTNPVLAQHASLEAELARQTAQAQLLTDAKAKLNVTTSELAELLGTNRDTLNGWLAAKDSSRYREMPKMAKLLLAYILKDARKRGA